MIVVRSLTVTRHGRRYVSLSAVSTKPLTELSQKLHWLDDYQVSPRISRIGNRALLHRHHEHVVQEI